MSPAQFDHARAILNDARRTLEERESALARATRARVVLSRRLERTAGRSVALDDELRRARTAEAEARNRFEEALRENERLTDAFGPTSDPRTAIAEWNAETPLLLLPVRLEARFKHGVRDAAGVRRDELWVRVYPDDCSIDSFEAELSETEYASARQYWIETWAAGSGTGSDLSRRAAWRNLAASHGAGRAEWIVSQLPVTGAPPARADYDVILVIPAESEPAEQEALTEYWEAVWRAPNDKEALDAARVRLSPRIAGEVEPLIAENTPANLTAAPPPSVKREEARVAVTWLILTPVAPGKLRSSSQPSRVRVLPDRFVVVGYQNGTVVFEAVTAPIASPLVVSVDFSATDRTLADDPDLRVPAELRWMTDFEEAVAVGMGARIPLDPTKVDLQAPIDRLIAVGVRLSEDAAGGQRLIEELITHHRFARTGFSFMPQGAPTNNTAAADSAFRREDDTAVVPPEVQQFPPCDWWSRRDGEWFANALGISPDLVARVDGAHRTDFAEARAMNRALWPATLGYALDTMLAPILTHEVTEALRSFFTHFVAGRGFLPCLRIGDQPYGVLPVSALAQWTWLDEAPQVGGLSTPPGVLSGLAGVLAGMRTDWRRFAASAARVSAPGDPHQTFLDVIALHPTSVEFHARYAESLEHLYNLARLNGSDGGIQGFADDLAEPGYLLLRRLGYRGSELPDALRRFFSERAARLNGPLVDDRPLSERDPLSVSTPDGMNYLAWLAVKARTAFEDLRQERGFRDGTPPRALLYALLRHALLLGYWSTALDRLTDGGATSAASLDDARREATMVHVASEGASESRYAQLYGPAPNGEPGTMGDSIRATLSANGPAGTLGEQLDAIDFLQTAPTARLERCLVEHLDTASHRLDAWLLGLVHYQLSVLRSRQGSGDSDVRRGLYVGAVGWLENLERRSDSAAVPLPETLAAIFGDEPAVRDPANGGYLLAPSLTHAKTAAVLRAGHLSAKTPQASSPLAVNLSSARVRAALELIEGLRNGQPLGALLGYRLQRALHESNLDRFVAPLRQKYPLVANQLASTRAEGVPIEAVEAHNVIDGRKLVEDLTDRDLRAFVAGLQIVPPATAAETTSVVSEIGRLFDVLDALADLALAEGVHQAVQGNYDRVAATLEAYSKGTFPPEPDVVRTPRSGVALTHRIGLHFETGVTVDATAWPGAPSPRSMAQPMLNAWLATMLPAPAKIVCRVSWRDSQPREAFVSASQLQFQPIDLLYAGTLDGETALRELEDRVLRRVVETRTPRADAELRIDHLSTFDDDRVSFFELGALIRLLRTLVLSSRPLTAVDMAPHGQTGPADAAIVSIDPERVRRGRTNLGALRNRAAALDVTTLDVDTAITRGVAILADASSFGFQQVGWGYLYLDKRRSYGAILTALEGVAARWTSRGADFAARSATYTAAAPALGAGERLAALASLELFVSTTATSPRPSSVNTYETILQTKATAFDAKLAALQSLIEAPPSGLDALLARVEQLITQNPSFDRFDHQAFDLDAHKQAADRIAAGLQARIRSLISEIDRRMAAVDDALTTYSAAHQASSEVSALQSAGTALLGDDVKLIPQIAFAPAQQGELSAASSGSSGLLSHLESRGVDLPVDGWLHGVARVRDKMFALEQASAYAQALVGRRGEIVLTPLQLPFFPNESWLALEFDPAAPPTGERLLYTARYPAAPDTHATCGLVVDEWTEVLPAKDETAGLAFHYNRPSSEAPQVWLLVTAPRLSGSWKWTDVLGALDETFDLMRIRAVEPSHLEPTPYARFLPATTSAAALHDVSITLNLARTNDYVSHLERRRDG